MRYNRAQIAAAWCEAGGDPRWAALAAAVALAESNGETDAVSEGRAGLWMARPAADGQPWAYLNRCDPAEAAKEAIWRSSNGAYWGHFPGFTNGAYKQFLPPNTGDSIPDPHNPGNWRADICINGRVFWLEITRHSGPSEVVISAGRRRHSHPK